MKRIENILYRNVNVIPMNTETILPAQDVYIDNGIIAKIEPAGKSAKQEKYTEIDGTGKYLMPALWDMHVHLFNDEFLDYLLSWGVTTVLNLWGFPQILKWKRQIASGERIGPDIYSSGPIIDSTNTYSGVTIAKTREEARQAVIDTKAAGYDFVKIYNNLTEEAYDEIAKACKELGMRLVGHLPNVHNPDYTGERRDYEIWQETIEHIVFLNEDNVEKIAASGIWYDPTFLVDDIPDGNFDVIDDKWWAVINTLRPGIRDFYWKLISLGHDDTKPEGFQKTVRRDQDYYGRVFREFISKGGRWMLGTDSGFANVVPGYSVHQELGYVVGHGITNYQALRAATLSGTEFLGVGSHLGSVEVGKEAQLLLLNNNPLTDIRNTLDIASLLKRDEYFTAQDLQGIRDAAYSRPESSVECALLEDKYKGVQAMLYYMPKDKQNSPSAELLRKYLQSNPEQAKQV